MLSSGGRRVPNGRGSRMVLRGMVSGRVGDLPKSNQECSPQARESATHNKTKLNSPGTPLRRSSCLIARNKTAYPREVARMEHSEKLRRLEESRQRGRVGGMIYPVANQQGCVMAPFQFAQVAGLMAPKKLAWMRGVKCESERSTPRRS